MKILRVLLLAAFALLALASHQAQAKAPRACRRVRKPWEAFTQIEQDTYVKAVGLAMEKGYFALFTKVHANAMSSNQAHNTCGFLLWHRRLLLAYENMLRSFGPEFKCVTIPVWNIFGAFAMQTQKKCRSMEECSPLLQALGGSKGIDKTLQIESRKFGPNCVNNGPVGKYCDGPGMDFAKCTKCIPRGNWASTALPDSLSYSNLINMLSSVTGAKDLNQNVQHSAHDHVHSAMKGVMGSFYSPLDPVFFSLHTTMDMLHHLYYTCNIDGYLTPADKKSLPKAWQSCAVNGGPQAEATSDIVMEYFVGDKTMSVTVDEHLKPFYEGVPTKFFELVDAADLGKKNSYSYRITTLLTDLMSNDANAFTCSHSARRRLLAMAGGDDAIDFSELDTGNNNNNATASNNKPATVSPANVETDAPAQGGGGGAGAIGVPDAQLVKTAQGQSEQTTTSFYYQALQMAKAKGENDKDARDLVELMECKIYNETVAPIEDFTEEFRFEFNIPKTKYPRCYELLVVQNKVEIDVPDWRPLAEEKLHVALAKPVDPSIPVSELDSPRAAEVEIKVVDELIVADPDTPVATAKPVDRKDISISAENAQTPLPTTAAPPTPPPTATPTGPRVPGSRGNSGDASGNGNGAVDAVDGNTSTGTGPDNGAGDAVDGSTSTGTGPDNGTDNTGTGTGTDKGGAGASSGAGGTKTTNTPPAPDTVGGGEGKKDDPVAGGEGGDDGEDGKDDDGNKGEGNDGKGGEGNVTTPAPKDGTHPTGSSNQDKDNDDDDTGSRDDGGGGVSPGGDSDSDGAAGDDGDGDFDFDDSDGANMSDDGSDENHDDERNTDLGSSRSGSGEMDADVGGPDFDFDDLNDGGDDDEGDDLGGGIVTPGSNGTGISTAQSVNGSTTAGRPTDSSQADGDASGEGDNQDDDENGDGDSSADSSHDGDDDALENDTSGSGDNTTVDFGTIDGSQGDGVDTGLIGSQVGTVHAVLIESPHTTTGQKDGDDRGDGGDEEEKEKEEDEEGEEDGDDLDTRLRGSGEPGSGSSDGSAGSGSGSDDGDAGFPGDDDDDQDPNFISGVGAPNDLPQTDTSITDPDSDTAPPAKGKTPAAGGAEAPTPTGSTTKKPTGTGTGPSTKMPRSLLELAQSFFAW